MCHIAKKRMLEDRGAKPKEEGDIVREYNAMHEEKFLEMGNGGENKEFDCFRCGVSLGCHVELLSEVPVASHQHTADPFSYPRALKRVLRRCVQEISLGS